MKTASLYNESLHLGESPIEIMEAVGSVAYNLRDDQLTADIVAECHELGRPVGAYSINDLARMPRLVQLGVDAIFTDWPDAMIDLLNE